MHYLNTKVTAHVRFKVTKGYIESNKKELENYISGSMEQILSQDSKFTAQSFYFYTMFINVFYILFSIILLYLISFNLLMLLLIFTLFIVPLKILYSKIILISSSIS